MSQGNPPSRARRACAALVVAHAAGAIIFVVVYAAMVFGGLVGELARNWATMSTATKAMLAIFIAADLVTAAGMTFVFVRISTELLRLLHRRARPVEARRTPSQSSTASSARQALLWVPLAGLPLIPAMWPESPALGNAAIRLHEGLGLLALFAVVLATRRVARAGLGLTRLGVLTLTIYPIAYTWNLFACSPLVLTVIFFVGYVPLFLLSHELPRVSVDHRFHLAVGILGWTLLLATGVSAAYSLASPNTIRFAHVHRSIHGWTVFPAIALLLVWGHERRRSTVAGYSANRAAVVRGIAAVLLSIAAGGALHHWRTKAIANAAAPVPLSTQARATAYGTEVANVQDAGLLRSHEVCRECHALSHAQWLGSTHAHAMNRSFLLVFRSLEQHSGRELARFCFACHGPEVALSARAEELAYDDEFLAAGEGVGCLACHRMTHAGDGGGRYALTLSRTDLIADPVLRRDTIAANVLAHVQDESPPAVRTGEVCFPCHRLMSTRRGVQHWPLDNVTAFEHSQFSAGLRCHECHMPRTELDDHQYSWLDHRMAGSNTRLGEVALHPSPERAQAIREFTRYTRNWLAGDLALPEMVVLFGDVQWKSYAIRNPWRTWSRLRSIESVVREPRFKAKVADVACQDDGTIRVTGEFVNNLVGHNYPSGLFANLSRVWASATVWDRRGQVVADSDPAGREIHWFGRAEVVDGGRWIEPVESFDYTDIEYRFLEPGRPRREEFVLQGALPLTDPPYRVQIRINSRRYPAQHLRALGVTDATDAPDAQVVKADAEFAGCPPVP